jgi:poly(A) polymerase
MARVYAFWHGAARTPATAPEPGLLREALFLHGALAARDALALIEAESSGAPGDEGFSRADAFLHDTPKPKTPFAASDLLARGLAPGAELGEALKRLQALWIRAGFPQEPAIVAKLIDEASGGLRGRIALDAPAPKMV